MLLRLSLLLFLSVVLLGCADEADPLASAPWVRTVAVEADTRHERRLSGVVRARYETPLAFQVGGRILTRAVDAGQQVTPDLLLFALDPRDFDEAERAAAAQLAAAEALLATANSELRRQEQLVTQGHISQDALDRFELAVEDASAQRDTANTALVQARNARQYAELRADVPGVLIDVTGEPGQVVAAGQSVAVLAQGDARDVEVFLPDASAPPQTGRLRLSDGSSFDIRLREIAGAADPVSRSWRARYQIADGATAVPLGIVVPVILLETTIPDDLLLVPLAALDERAEGPRVWRVIENKAEPLPVELFGFTSTHARIRATLAPGDSVIGLGTHLLTPGMLVREQRQ